MRPKVSRHDALLFMVVFIWGANFGVVKTALTEIDPTAFSALRLALGAPAMILILFLFERRILLENGGLVLRKSDIYSFLALSVFLASDFILFVRGLSLTTSANASILYSAVPILIAIFSLLKGKSIGRLGATGLTLAFAGVLLVIAAPQGLSLSVFLASGTLRGDILISIGVVSWALFTHMTPAC